jgi:hypothetical protein
MRKLDLFILAFAPLLASAAFANTGVNDGTIVQAQYSGQAERPIPMVEPDRLGGRSQPGTDTDPMNDTKTGDPKTGGKDKDPHKSGYNRPRSSSSKQDPPQDSSSQARKGSIEPKPSGE